MEETCEEVEVVVGGSLGEEGTKGVGEVAHVESEHSMIEMCPLGSGFKLK
ncbi:hypothetical protein A2U01_0078504, partial [Trifolium medium]|nr:hypothetical protein [Trifolium medium]